MKQWVSVIGLLLVLREDLLYWHEVYDDGVPSFVNGVGSGEFDIWVSANSASGTAKRFILQ